jgi:hypothetical protein
MSFQTGSIDKNGLARTEDGKLYVTSVGTAAITGGTIALTGLLDLSNAAAGQIKFPAVQNNSADANTLDDYEEGTWTPSLTFGGGSTGITYGFQSGSYQKIGNTVWLTGRITLTAKGSSTGAAVIGGLPFAVRNSNDSMCPCAVRLVTVSFANQYGAYALPNSSTIILEEYTEAGAVTAIDDANFSATSVVVIFGHYRVD